MAGLIQTEEVPNAKSGVQQMNRKFTCKNGINTYLLIYLITHSLHGAGYYFKS
jgi:hypothetical protein